MLKQINILPFKTLPILVQQIYMKRFLLPAFLFVVCFSATAQSDINKEKFNFSYLKNETGGKFVYSGKKHSFTIDIAASNIKPTDYPNYISIDGQVVQVSIVPLPESNPALKKLPETLQKEPLDGYVDYEMDRFKNNLDLSKLTAAQQKEALLGYLNYEMEYFKKELKLNPQNLKKEWMTINSKLWILWSFDVPAEKSNDKNIIPTKSQVYVSTICFNQVLGLNTPLIESNDPATAKALLTKMMGTLQLFNKKFE